MKKNKRIIYILSGLCILSILIMIYVVLMDKPKVVKKEFEPPDFDVNAVKGVPDTSQNQEWSEIYQDGMNYRVGICGKLFVNENNESEVYLFNSEENNVWVKLRILDDKDNIIFESGLIKQGEHLPRIKFNEEVFDKQRVKMKIMAYQPFTYYSEGTIILNTIINYGG